ncbi:ArsR/SmtB family transcription factor [Fictibacillus barbaricus]|uniref:Transcriptional regulator n=1 Tax=Fictibacillus barbaricus TaxID=182136 RepID=A0ABU1TZ09_9BACL|nr:metalloregulator ArsR/SmtB family transcription factor [Fictibacillus barbaricus]MDR7072444.1 putative transcriptional regulator [Fictibacillus barbaricus]
MNVLNIASRKRESYNIKLDYSLLWESALGIAAITNSRLFDTLEKRSEFVKYKKIMSKELLTELDFVEENNTWKCLLQLLHSNKAASYNLKEFIAYVYDLTEEEMRFICYPYTGINSQKIRKRASQGNEESIQVLKELTSDNLFFPSYIEFISNVDVRELKNHLIKLITKWNEVLINPYSEKLENILKNDIENKELQKNKMSAEEFVNWTTGGIHYTPEPNVQNVLLIPQLTYRPWNIESYIEGTKVFYYPVSNESISPDDKYLPNYFLIQKHKALGDEVRLKMIKLLYERDFTLQEITEKLELGKSTAHHHLKILRAATLVEIKSSKYRLRDKSINSLPKELEIYLNQ